MKFATIQQKIILSAKIFACILLLGVLGWLSFAPSMSQQVGAASTRVGVTVGHSPPVIDADEVGDTGMSVPITGDYNNVNRIEVYLDDGDGVFDPDKDTLLVGSVSIGNNGDFSGSVLMPDGTKTGAYDLIVVGYTANTNNGYYDDYVYDTITVNYTSESPDITCVFNEDSKICHPGPPEQAYGYENDYTTIVIDGENFGDIGNTTATVGGQECKIISVSENRIVCVVPPAKDGQTGAQDVEVCVSGLCDKMVGGFMYRAIAGVPSTGLFRVGERIITVNDAILWGGLIVIAAGTVMLIMIVKTPKKARYSSKGGSSKKRNYHKQKVTFSSSKKTPKRK